MARPTEVLTGTLIDEESVVTFGGMEFRVGGSFGDGHPNTI